MHDSGCWVTITVATIAISPSNAASITAHPLVLFLCRSRCCGPIHTKQAESVPIKLRTLAVLSLQVIESSGHLLGLL